MEDITMTEGDQPLFADLKFTIIPNSIPEQRLEQLATDVKAAGGTLYDFDVSKGRIDNLENITYIISATSDFPDYHEALDRFKHVVKPSWVDACLSASKVKNPRTFSPDPGLFMGDIVICCGNNIPEGDKEAIEGGVIAMGGQYTLTLSKLVTHLIVLDMEDPRCQLAAAKRLKLHILLPHWFDDCLKIGRRISERPYLLPHPEILNVKAGVIPPIRPSQHIRDAANPEPVNEPFPPTPSEQSEPARAIKAFHDKKVMLGDDLPLSDRLKGIIIELIQAGGGDVTSNVEEAHIYVCNYREGSDYVTASQAKKDVGNLSWLYYMIAHGIWTNPMRRMMHYPRPRGGIPGFGKYKISISSYTGEARVYLENLVKATGAEFTKTFKQDNTHLIAAHKHSEKCEAAEEWNVHVVNHIWLEESYARCKEQTLTDPRYVTFPDRINLGEVLGQTEIDRDAVEKHYFPKVRKSGPTKGASRQSNVPASNVSTRVAGDTVARGTPLKEKAKVPKSATGMATPLASRHKEDKENETPGTTGSRGAKDRALSKLHESAPDIAKFEKEMKRKGGVIHGGRREEEPEHIDKPNKTRGRDSSASKRSIDEVDAEEGSSDEEMTEDPARKNKKAKKGKLTPIKYRMLISKDDRWVDDPDKESKDKGKLRELGLFITEDYKKVDLLCAPSVVRTKKFVAALTCAPTLVSTTYIDYALKHGKLPPPEKHVLSTRDFEKQYGFRLDESIVRAKQNQKRLLRDWTIFCTSSVKGGFDTFKEIITANGGRCQQFSGRTSNITASKRPIDPSNKEVSQNQEEDERDVLYLISEPLKTEVTLWTKFRELAKKHDMIPRIVTIEWLLFVAMAQYVHWDPKWELNERVVNATTK